MLGTSRLLLRPFEPDDAEVAFGWFGDPAVMRFMAGGPHTRVQQTRKRLKAYQKQQARLGFSKWIVIETHSGRAIGDSGLIVSVRLDRRLTWGFVSRRVLGTRIRDGSSDGVDHGSV